MKALLFILPLLAGSCGVVVPVKDAEIYHILDPTVPDRRISGSSPAVAVADPSLPGYLDRQQFVSRSGDGTIVMNNRHLWSEPLAAGIARVISANLRRLTNSLNIQPSDAFVGLDYQKLLEIRISRFEPDVTGILVLECTWKLQPVNGPVANTHAFSTSIPEPPDGTTTPPDPWGHRLDAMNEALTRLAREIAGGM